MHILTSSPKLKHRSHSLPLLPGPVPPVHPIHKARKNNLQSSQHSAFLPFISLQDKTHGEEVDCKIRGIQRRNVRKLEERYDTIDRWKEKYIPEASMLIIRHKMAIEKALPQMESSHELHKSSATVSRGVNNKFQKLLPIISAKILSIQVPDHRQLSRRLQMELVSRLERNKRLHAKGKLAQAINYFQSSSRQNIENSRKKCKIINHSDPIQPRQRPHKGSLDSPFSHFDKHMSHAGYKGPTNPEDDRLELFQAIRMRKAKSIVEFKEDLFNEAAEQAPQGWAVSNQPPFGDEQD